MEQVTDFYLVLPSNVLRSTMFPENTLSHYHTQLNRPREFRGNWEVALVEACYPMTIVNIKEPVRITLWVAQITLNASNKYDLVERNVVDCPVTIKDILSAGVYNEQTELIEIINSTLASIWDNRTVPDKSVSSYDVPQFSYNRNANRLQLALGSHTVGSTSYVVYPKFLHAGATSLEQLLGFPSRYIEGQATMLKTKIRAKHELNMRQGGSFLFVYTDIINPVFVGDTEVPLLRSIPIRYEKSGSMVTDRFERPYYIRLSRPRVTSIEILILNESGDQITFADSKLQLTLHFRPAP